MSSNFSTQFKEMAFHVFTSKRITVSMWKKILFACILLSTEPFNEHKIQHYSEYMADPKYKNHGSDAITPEWGTTVPRLLKAGVQIYHIYNLFYYNKHKWPILSNLIQEYDTVSTHLGLLTTTLIWEFCYKFGAHFFGMICTSNNVTQIMVHQKDLWILAQSGFKSCIDAPWSEWSWIFDHNRDHPKETNF